MTAGAGQSHLNASVVPPINSGPVEPSAKRPCLAQYAFRPARAVGRRPVSHGVYGRGQRRLWAKNPNAIALPSGAEARPVLRLAGALARCWLRIFAPDSLRAKRTESKANAYNAWDVPMLTDYCWRRYTLDWRSLIDHSTVSDVTLIGPPGSQA